MNKNKENFTPKITSYVKNFIVGVDTFEKSMDKSIGILWENLTREINTFVKHLGGGSDGQSFF